MCAVHFPYCLPEGRESRTEVPTAVRPCHDSRGVIFGSAGLGKAYVQQQRRRFLTTHTPLRR